MEVTTSRIALCDNPQSKYLHFHLHVKISFQIIGTEIGREGQGTYRGRKQTGLEITGTFVLVLLYSKAILASVIL
jgi:hypothetical protein